MKTITGKTKSGFEFNIPEGVADDYRFIRAYKKIRSNDTGKQIEGATEMVTAVLGSEEAEDKFLAHVAEQNGGRAPVEAVYKEITEIVNIASKKSAEVKK